VKVKIYRSIFIKKKLNEKNIFVFSYRFIYKLEGSN
jgi:hypothetical protein